MAGRLSFAGDRWLLFSCGFRREFESFSRLLCTGGRIHLTNPFHPGASDTIEVITENERRVETAATEEFSFTAAIRHIQAVVAGTEEPRHLAVDEALGNARAIDLLTRSARAST
jgi:hypothetical protein